MTNEFWLVNYQGVNGWIELGYQNNGHTPPYYFWAVLDPDTALFTSHHIADISAEEIGTSVAFDIHQTGEDTFVISVDGTKTHFSTTTVVNLWDGTYGGYVQVGQELSGTSGAAASVAWFVNNQIYNANGSHRFVDERDGFSEKIDKPPYGAPLQKPRAGNNGGVMGTWCCTPP